MKTILIVEDDTTLRENILDFLREEGYNAISAEDGLVGLQLALSNAPDLILCDIMMPKMNGYDFFKTIQQIKSIAAIPFIFITAKGEREDIRTGMQLGADDYIAKPFDLNDLLMAINTRLQKVERIQQVSDEKFFTLVDNPLMGVFVCSENKFEFVNDTFAKIFGLKKSAYLEITFANLISEKEKEFVLEKIHRCFKKIHNNLHITFEAFTENKKAVKIEMYAGIVNYNGADCLVGNVAQINRGKSKPHFSISKDKSAELISKKELNILAMVCQGLSTNEISEHLGRSKRTIETQRASLLMKAGVKNTAELVMYAIQNNLLNKSI